MKEKIYLSIVKGKEKGKERKGKKKNKIKRNKSKF